MEQIKVFFVVVVFFFFFNSPFPLTFFLASGEDVTPSPSQPLISFRDLLLLLLICSKA